MEDLNLNSSVAHTTCISDALFYKVQNFFYTTTNNTQGTFIPNDAFSPFFFFFLVLTTGYTKELL